jgi:hypothetical protein
VAVTRNTNPSEPAVALFLSILKQLSVEAPGADE